jgi:hypothetical protein
MNQHPDNIIDGDFEAVDFAREVADDGNGRSPYDLEEPVQIKALEVTYERKFNLGNFESLHGGVTIWARTRVPEGHSFDLHDAKLRLRDMARTNVRAQLLRVKERSEPLFLGLAPPADGRADPIYVRTVGVSLCRKVNLENYENVAPSYSDWADVRHLSGSQTALHVALERLWACLWANIEDEIRRARGLGSHPDAYFGLPDIEVEEESADAADGRPLALPPGAITGNGHGRNGARP